jgi:hypothetical protein
MSDWQEFNAHIREHINKGMNDFYAAHLQQQQSELAATTQANADPSAKVAAKPPEMLPGRNALLLNHATVIKAIQHYFDTVVFRPGAAKVMSITTEDGGSVFKVIVEEEKTR